MTIETNHHPKDTEEKTAKKKLTRPEQINMPLRRPVGAMIAYFHKSVASQPHTARVAFSTLRKTRTTIERLEPAKGSAHRIAHEA